MGSESGEREESGHMSQLYTIICISGDVWRGSLAVRISGPGIRHWPTGK